LALALTLGAGIATAAVHQAEVTKLPKPPWTRGGPSGPASVGLVLVSSRPTEITDSGKWFARHRLATGEVALGSLLGGPLARFRGHELIRAIRERELLLLTYGRDFSSGRYLVAHLRPGNLLYVRTYDHDLVVKVEPKR
jgi:hypothetical protein